jgi:hypothetical protein
MNGDIVTLLGAHLKAILYGVVIVVGGISLFAHRSLFNNLKRYEPSQWEALGSPEVFLTTRDFSGFSSLRNEGRLHWYILSMKHRRSASQRVRASGNAVFASGLVLWVLVICLLTIA